MFHTRARGCQPPDSIRGKQARWPLLLCVNLHQRTSAGTQSAESAGNFFPQIPQIEFPQICAEQIVASIANTSKWALPSLTFRPGACTRARGCEVSSSIRRKHARQHIILCVNKSQFFSPSSVNPIVVPTSGLLRTCIDCPCASMICLQIASPRPVPPLSRLRAVSVR